MNSMPIIRFPWMWSSVPWNPKDLEFGRLTSSSCRRESCQDGPIRTGWPNQQVRGPTKSRNNVWIGRRALGGTDIEAYEVMPSGVDDNPHPVHEALLLKNSIHILRT